MTNKCQCGNDKEDWQSICKQCFAKSKGGANPKTKDRDIKRQVFLKVASEQLGKGNPNDLVKYAKDLELEFNKWA